MQVVLWCGGVSGAWNEVMGPTPDCLLSLVDRPMLQHVVEHLVDSGFHDFHVVCDADRTSVQQILGDGTRWGSTVRYWDVRDAVEGEGLTQALTRLEPGPFLLGSASTLPVLERGFLTSVAAPVTLIGVVDPRGQAVPRWTGWGWATDEEIGGLLGHLRDGCADDLVGHRLPLACTLAAGLLDVRSPAALLASQTRLLEGGLPGTLLSGRQPTPGVWVGRAARISPSARLVPPVFVGAQARINDDVELGPHAVIGEGSVVDRGSVVRRSAVGSGNYVGQHLHLDLGVAVGRHLVDTALGTTLEVTDRFLLDRL